MYMEWDELLELHQQKETREKQKRSKAHRALSRYEQDDPFESR
jgi:hypothetical protein